MGKIHLTDAHWAFTQPLRPPPARTGRPRADDRRTIEGILYILITGCRWQDLPRECGAPTTVWRRLKRRGEAGVRERIWRTARAALDMQGKLDWSTSFLDGSFAPSKNGGEKVGLTRKGKGAKWMLVVDGNGLPLGFHFVSANMAKVALAEQTLDTIRVDRACGRPKRRPEKLVADRGYDSQAFGAALRRRCIGMCIPLRIPLRIPPKRRPAAWRAKQGHPLVARKEEYRLAIYGGMQLRLVGRLPAAADPLGAIVQRLPERIRFRRDAAVWAPSDCPRVPDPVGLSRARAAYAARSVQPTWSTNGSGPRQRMR